MRTSLSNMQGTKRMYLGATNDGIALLRAQLTEEPNRERIDDGAVWTIVSTEDTEYR